MLAIMMRDTIQSEGAFILFYAGHGGRMSILETWTKAGYFTTDGQVEQVVPSDNETLMPRTNPAMKLSASQIASFPQC